MGNHEISRILVVDDDPMITSALSRLLRGEFRLELAGDLAQARERVAKENFAVALVDLHLKDENGFTLLSRLAAESPLTVRVLMSGTPSLEDLARSPQGPLIHRCLPKPWEPATLPLFIRECFDLHRLLAEKDRLELLAVTDPMTGLPNFRMLERKIPVEIERARRFDRHLSLIMLDLDDFKDFNDSRGHLAGDRLLADLGNLLKRGIRTFDCAFRYGGDELCLLLPDTGLDDAALIADRLRARVASDLPLTVSAGVSAFPERSVDARTLMESADRALYSAKNQGRNRCVIAAPAEPR